MILFEPAAGPTVRAGELELAGRRVAVRAIPYSARSVEGAFEFDPIERQFLRRKRPASIAAGPASPEEWRQALARVPAGPVLVGPGDEQAEAVWGAFSAAAEGARRSGRAVYLFDAPEEILPADPGSAFVAFWRWDPERGLPASAIGAAAALGIPAGGLFPLLPGWTGEGSAVEAAVTRVRTAGGRFLAPVLPSGDGGSRRAIVEALSEMAPEQAEAIFSRIHHGDWEGDLASALARFRRACGAAGIACAAPRPRGVGEPDGNALAAASLEDRIRTAGADEHRVALLMAAVRWIDESGRDLTRIAREGNFRKVFPWEAELGQEVEEALLGQAT